MTRGILLYAFKSEELDYMKIACSCALSIKHNLKNNNITLVTDEMSLSHMTNEISSETIKYAFDKIILKQTPTEDNQRTMYSSPHDKFNTQFINGNRHSAYDISPYDETLLMDVDYLVQSNKLDMVWETKEDILVNKNAVNLRNEKFHEKNIRLCSSGIPMYWATLVYFKKSETAKLLFDLVSYIKEHYNFYKFLYGFPGSTYRNDYVFSIALHILGGFNENTFKSLPVDTIITMDQKDEIVNIDENSITFLSNDVNKFWKDILVKTEFTDVHLMNKVSMLKHFDKILELYKDGNE